MRSALNTRLKRLEARAKATRPVEAPAPSAEGIQRLLAKFARMKEEAKAGTDPDPQVRLAYWRRALAEQEAIVANGGKREGLYPINPTVLDPEGMNKLTLKFAQTGLRSVNWRLLEAQLATLAQAGHNSPELDALRQEHGQYVNIPWQWRGPTLPAEAEKLLAGTAT